MDARALAVATAVMPGTLGIMAATRAATAAPLASGNALFYGQRVRRGAGQVMRLTEHLPQQ